MDSSEDNPWVDESVEVAEELGEVSEPEISADAPIETPPVADPIKQPSIQDSVNLISAICVIDFHHIRGPEIEFWYDSNSGTQSQESQLQFFTNKWPNLPFQLLPDGAHQFEETFSNFTLLQQLSNEKTTLFGCACIRQLDSNQLLSHSDEVTRSIVQKSVVLISKYPITIQIREKLSIVTRSFFEQHDFNDKKVIRELYDNLSLIYNNDNTRIENDSIDLIKDSNDQTVGKLKKGEVLYESDFYMGLNLKDMLLRYKRNLLVIFKLIMLEKRIIFFSKDLLKLSNFQFSVISLIPNLILNLQDCGSYELDNLSKKLQKPSSFNSLDRASILRFIGLPLQIFNKGGFFEPYLALQQLESLHDLHWYMIGSSNDLILDQKLKIADIIVYIDHPVHKNSIEFIDHDLEQYLQLTSLDRKMMDFLLKKTQLSPSGQGKLDPSASPSLVDETSATNPIFNDLIIEDLIRSNFENYLIGFLSCVKYQLYMDNANSTQLQSLQESSNQASNLLNKFNRKFVEKWQTTLNFDIFNKYSYNEFFTLDEFKPAHIMDDSSSNNGNTEMMNNFINFWQTRFKPAGRGSAESNSNDKDDTKGSVSHTASTSTDTSNTGSNSADPKADQTPETLSEVSNKSTNSKRNFIQQSWNNYWYSSK